MFKFTTNLKLKLIFSKKILRMTKSSQMSGLNGRVINLFANDFEKLENSISCFQDVWKAPLQTFLLGYFIYREIGVSGIIGVAFILSLIPIQCQQLEVYQIIIILINSIFQLTLRICQRRSETEQRSEPISE